VHGEHEAFCHLINSCSGVIREKIEVMFRDTVPLAERNQLATLIYYPKEKLQRVLPSLENPAEWYRITLHRLVELTRATSSRYSRSKVRKSLPPDYAYIIEELLHTHSEEVDKHDYFENIISTVIEIDQADGLIEALATVIKRSAVDQLHLVGDIFDRGPRADLILDELMHYHSVDIQWGNHDILWMGAACGSRTLVATVLSNSIHYNNLEVIETGYGISLRPLSVFANEVYQNADVSRFAVKLTGENAEEYTEKEKLLSARMHKAITVILFKLEGQKLLRHPEYGMEDRLLLDKIDYEKKCITIGGVTWPLEDTDFPTVDPKDPYTLTPEEDSVIRQLTAAFVHSEKLQQHIRFLYSKGSFYKIYNGNLIFHGCIPMTPEGGLMSFSLGGKERSGQALFDYADQVARKAYYIKEGDPEKKLGMDFLWFLWAGRNSPLFGKDRMTTFERRLIKDEDAWTEPKNAYYKLYQKKEVCLFLLEAFGLTGEHSHIINGHVPVKTKKGESPIKGGGKLIVIDGGFCKAYQSTSGIAGYTLIFNSQTFRIVSHQPFAGQEKALEENFDITSTPEVFERMDYRLKIKDSDIGCELERQISELMALLQAFRDGAVKESHR
ncbi:MAG: fructose-1,6-bisphosphatase, partial [Lachnospiraceae bacterium]|nr:fructose-1,6-bisphosphatase [Lachnospiraceae bacterium]